MTETATLTLSLDVWTSLHAMASGQRGPLHAERQVMQAFEAAFKAAQQPQPPPDEGKPD